MSADLGFIDKLWNKGIDISAGIITSTVSAAIVAVIATAAWRVKLWLDLKNDEAKQRQQHRIKQELEAPEHKMAEVARVTRLQAELKPLVEHLKAAANGPDLQIAWDRYADWLRGNDLQYLPDNQKVMQAWGNQPFGQMVQQNASTRAPIVAADAEKTQLQTGSA
jgi:hypothetical protein